jgi:hypothetical protein
LTVPRFLLYHEPSDCYLEEFDVDDAERMLVQSPGELTDVTGEEAHESRFKKTVPVKANPELFKRYRAVATEVVAQTDFLRSLFQNDKNIHPSEIIDWLQRWEDFRRELPEELNSLEKESLEYIRACKANRKGR